MEVTPDQKAQDVADKFWVERLRPVIEAAVAAERKACAAVAENWTGRRLEGHDDATEVGKAFGRGVDMASHYIAAAIRGRGNE